jgi:predicted ribosomally synthesized peptide with SipW-like signal peptide
MKNVFLSVVVICALAVAGVGGTLAGFSDTEESFNNYIATGSLDLKVEGKDQAPYGAGVDGVIQLDDVMPDKEYRVTVKVRNDGQAQDGWPNQGNDEPAYLYIMFKNFKCDNIAPKHDGIDLRNHTGVNGTVDPDEMTNWDISSFLKPEPEMVAEFGGWVEQTWVDGVGQTGDECCMSTHTRVTVEYRGSIVASGLMADLLSTPPGVVKQFYCGELPPCGTTYDLVLKFKVDQSLMKDDTWTGHPKFEYWPANAFMTDKLSFSTMFELLQEKWVPPVG